MYTGDDLPSLLALLCPLYLFGKSLLGSSQCLFRSAKKTRVVYGGNVREVGKVLRPTSIPTASEDAGKTAGVTSSQEKHMNHLPVKERLMVQVFTTRQAAV